MRRFAPRLRHVHASGYVGATAAQLGRALDRYAGAGADVITLTEAGGAAHANLLEDWSVAHGFTLWHPAGRGRAENAILANATTTRLRRRRCTKLTGLRLRTDRDAPLHATSARIQHALGGRPVRFTVSHLPAHVEGTGGLRPGHASRVWRATVRGLRGWHRRYGGLHVVAGDFNVNVRREWVEAYLGDALAGLDVAYDLRNLPTRGTFKSRLIDLLGTNCQVADPTRVLRVQPGFDHAAIGTVIRAARR